MSFGIVHRFPGGTQQQYENALKAVHPNGGKDLPAGQTLHVAGATDDGWIIMAVHESKESWEDFRDNVLTPGLAKLDNAFQGPPEETSFEVYKVQTA
jgi:hypothetical protein